MVASNSGGEKVVRIWQSAKFRKLAPSYFFRWKRIYRQALKLGYSLKSKMNQKDFEGQLYSQIYSLCKKNYDVIKSAKPAVSKNSMGYNLWNVWDKQTKVFDLSQLIIGSEGTLGFVTEINYRLVKARPHSGLLVLFMKSITDSQEN